MLGNILRELVTPKFFVLYIYLASVCYVHFRGKVRLRFGRQLLEHSGLFAPFNSLLYLFSDVSSKPILDAKDFPELAPLKENWQTIRDEAQSRCTQQGGHHPKARTRTTTWPSTGVLQARLEALLLPKWYGDYLPSAEKLCPKTTELLKQHPDASTPAMFTLMAPPRADPRSSTATPSAASLRYHLGLITPNSDGCTIWIDGEPHSWRDGEDLVFDETYVHNAANETDTTRVILFCDFTRPLKTPIMRAFNRFMIRYVFRVTKSQNVESEKVGLFNRFTAAIYRYKYFLQRCKKKNKFLYYAVKWAFILGLVYLVFLRNWF